ncbi:NADPH:quinone reductase-like Zn-dependent oxidoreductase [Paraburkholderia terricola]|nr:NADPH:quinone reductase-like Zn-dependent oxidoreductase [Paraburkholderia terricola]
MQLAKLAGARVTGTASAGNRDYVQSLGATEVIDYAAENFAARASKFDVVLDLVGGDTQARSWSVLKPGGILVSTVSKPDPAHGHDVGATGKNFATVQMDRCLQRWPHCMPRANCASTLIRSFPFRRRAMPLHGA